MRDGTAVNIDQMIADVKAGQQILMKDKKYIGISGNPRTVLNRIYEGLWSWEPAMGGRAVGGGEMAMILNHPDGQKGEGTTGGDVVIKGKYKIEMKKASASDSGAAFGSNKNFLIPTPKSGFIIRSPGEVNNKFLKFCFTSSL